MRKNIIKDNTVVGKGIKQVVNNTKVEITRKELNRLKRNNKFFIENSATNLFLRFSLRCYDMAEEIKSDVYVAHGVHSLMGASIMAEKVGGKCFCDVIEIPSFKDRLLLPNWHPTNLSLLDNAFENYLRNCDEIFTVGWTLKSKILHYEKPVHVIPNYRYAEKVIKNDNLRIKCKLRDNEKLIVAISSLTFGVEDVLSALNILPNTIHLAIIGSLRPSEYEIKIKSLISELNLENRVHLFDPVPYEELTSILSSADVGLIIRDINILNNYVSLPNRVFDYMFSGIPIVSPDIPDIAKIIKENQMGEVIELQLSPEAWAKAIENVLDNLELMKKSSFVASKKYTWENIESALIEQFKGLKTITYVGYNDLTINNRTIRMAKTLVKAGFEVKICTRFKGLLEVKRYKQDGIDFILFPMG